MAFWRMQLHPSDPSRAMKYAAESIGAGFIGLDFRTDLGDMNRINPATVDEGQAGYLDFLKIAEEDHVLIVVHHFPFALVQVAGPYNYIASPEKDLGVWFRHFRRIHKERTLYYADKVKNAQDWEPINMPATLGSLVSPDTKSYRLIEEWLRQG